MFSSSTASPLLNTLSFAGKLQPSKLCNLRLASYSAAKVYWHAVVKSKRKPAQSVLTLQQYIILLPALWSHRDEELHSAAADSDAVDIETGGPRASHRAEEVVSSAYRKH